MDLADLNRDGTLDLIAPTPGAIGIYFGNQAQTLVNDGTFKSQTSFVAQSVPTC